MAAFLLALLLAAEGRPLFYWGARPAVIETSAADRDPDHARVLEVHAALDGADLVLRFTFDRPVREALRLPGGAPVSGRLRATLDIDADGDRASGLAAGERDTRTGADRRVEVSTRYLGGDPEERREPEVDVTARLLGLAADGGRRTLWRADDSDEAGRLSWHGDVVELRIPEARIGLEARARFLLVEGAAIYEGRLEPGGSGA